MADPVVDGSPRKVPLGWCIVVLALPAALAVQSHLLGAFGDFGSPGMASAFLGNSVILARAAWGIWRRQTGWTFVYYLAFYLALIPFILAVGGLAARR